MADENTILEINKELERENLETENFLNKLLESIDKNTKHHEINKKRLGEQLEKTTNPHAKKLYLKIQKWLSKSQENNLETEKKITEESEKGKIYNPLYEEEEHEERRLNQSHEL